ADTLAFSSSISPYPLIWFNFPPITARLANAFLETSPTRLRVASCFRLNHSLTLSASKFVLSLRWHLDVRKERHRTGRACKRVGRTLSMSVARHTVTYPKLLGSADF